jgi:hypothetical protein
MAYEASIVTDSMSESGNRLTTLRVSLPKLAVTALSSYRTLSLTCASDDQMSMSELLQNVLTDPFVPASFTTQDGTLVRSLDALDAPIYWLIGRDRALTTVLELLLSARNTRNIFGYDGTPGFATATDLSNKFDEALRMLDDAKAFSDIAPLANLSVRHISDILMPYMWQVAVVTATDWEEVFALEKNTLAPRPLSVIAGCMRNAIENSTPKVVRKWQWHAPFLRSSEEHLMRSHEAMALRLSSARCACGGEAAVDIKAVDAYCARLAESGNMSAFEHVATPIVPTASAPTASRDDQRSGNLTGWRQLRTSMETRPLL